MTSDQFRSSRSLAIRCSAGLVFMLVLAARRRPDRLFRSPTWSQTIKPPNPAQITDPNLVNPWGVSFSPTSPLWVSDEGTGVSTLYKITPSNQVTMVTGADFPVNIQGGDSDRASL